VSLVNLAGRRLGLAPGAEAERDLGQVRTAIDALRALVPVLEQGETAREIPAIKQALSQLQMAYAREAGAAPEGAPSDEPSAPPPPAAKDQEPEQPGSGPGPAQSSGRLWVPGQ
jgi:hypothetical protein